MSPPRVVAHRGAAAEAPENTLEAFALAAELGADGLELDVRRSSDDRLVVIHDPTLDRTTGRTGAVSGRTAAELEGLGVPSLERVFDLHPDLPMTVDVKEPEATRRVVELIARFGRTSETTLYVEDGTRLPAFRGYAGSRATSTRQALFLALARWLPGFPAAGFPEVVHTPLRRAGIPVVRPGFVRAVHRSGRTVQVWTVDEPAVMLRLAEWGVDAIVTNDVRGARACLGGARDRDTRGGGRTE
ncbi:MAG: glycerophosphodiester phosphodiesterase family protein [Candidatus Palauibacterales bacterium]|nr:glycerophosphodiester phosphodiesterase family protein [Candidatus Palauibacterales bacterium]MDP2528200.1 glycerophosphodiester phosphodiesterase family protein [Candidatus Palauibacterales bacterium]MDP2584860.1 glycerophosphodiester phosphodiesterase family protein [Candidatus Palauibacterales bacterium]